MSLGLPAQARSPVMLGRAAYGAVGLVWVSAMVLGPGSATGRVASSRTDLAAGSPALAARSRLQSAPWAVIAKVGLFGMNDSPSRSVHALAQ